MSNFKLNNHNIFIVFFIVSIVACVSCQHHRIKQTNSYEITKEYIRWYSNIRCIRIELLENNELNSDNYPVSNKVIKTFCCESNSNLLTNIIYFTKPNNGYTWSVCSTDLTYVENDSFKNLSVEEKLKIIVSKDTINTYNKFEVMPFVFEFGKLYHLIGLEDIEGSFYLHLNSNNELVVRYYQDQ